MNDFNFKGEWELNIEMNQLTHLKFFNSVHWETQKLKLKNGLVNLVIIKEDQNKLTPTTEQISCINWITGNQDKILNLLYSALKENIFPYYVNLWRDDPDNENVYPTLNSIPDLEKALGIYLIEILFECKDEISYYRLYFNFCTDQEHRLIITLHRDRLIDFCGIGDMDNRKIIEDLGLDYSEWLDEMRKKNKTL